jgi:hypothetical protein|eukprot:COSAG01_NODE_15716_length_1306_cov_30.827672_1_plen_71_part_00
MMMHVVHTHWQVCLLTVLPQSPQLASVGAEVRLTRACERPEAANNVLIHMYYNLPIDVPIMALRIVLIVN